MSGRSPARRALLGVGIVVLTGLAFVAVFVPRDPGPRVPDLDPPAPAMDGLDPALVARIGELTAAVRATPGSAEAWGALGVLYDVHDLPREAALCYEPAIALAPGDFRWHYFLGLVQQHSDHLGALDHLIAARGINAEYAPLQLHLGRGLFDAGVLDDAQVCYETAARLDPQLVRPWIGLARVALARGDPQRAAEHLQRALSLGPRGGEVHFLLAEASRRLGDDEAAERHLAQAGPRMQFEEFADPIKAKSQWNAGVTMYWRAARSERYLQEGMVAQAEAEWRDLLRDDPRSLRAYLELGRILAGTGRAPEAIEAYRRALDVDPERHIARHQLGQLLFGQGQIDAGLEQLRRSVAAVPDDPDLQGNLARALTHCGRIQESLDVWLRYGHQLVATGRAEEALPAFGQGAELAPDDVRFTTGLADALVALDRRDEAIATLREALGGATDDRARATLTTLLAELE